MRNTKPRKTRKNETICKGQQQHKRQTVQQEWYYQKKIDGKDREKRNKQYEQNRTFQDNDSIFYQQKYDINFYQL